jgi:hypothetical protein
MLDIKAKNILVKRLIFVLLIEKLLHKSVEQHDVVVLRPTKDIVPANYKSQRLLKLFVKK